jgi:tol-pal system protein YbgF
MLTRAAALALVALAAVSLGACASSTEMDQANQNQQQIRGMVASDRQQLDSLQNQVRRLGDQVTEIKHGSEGGNDSMAAVSQRVSKLEADVAALQAAMASGAASGGAAGMVPGAMVPGAMGAPPAGAPIASAPAEPRPTWPQELESEIDSAESSRAQGAKLYREGLAAMKDGKYQVAVAKFAKLQHTYPKSELGEPSEYFSANALYESGKYDQAILQFNDLVMRFPKGRFSSQALLRQAEAFLKMNDRIDARLTLQKLVSDHAGTPEATAANTMMKSLVSD